MKTIVGLSLVFLSGFVCALNLITMYGSNTSYPASWWKIVVTIIIAVFGGFISKVDSIRFRTRPE